MESSECTIESAAFNSATHEARASRRSRFRAWLERYALALCVVFSVTPFALYLLAVRLESIVFDMTVANATALAPGALHEEVERALGAPLMQVDAGEKMFLMNTDRETWVYGRMLTYDAFYPDPPFFYPFNFRFGPTRDDLVIRFDTNGSVCEIQFPTKRSL